MNSVLAFMANTKPIEKDDVLKHLDQVLAERTESHDMDTMKKCITGAMDKKMREEKEEEAERQKRITSVIVISESKEKESERRVAEDESSISDVFAGLNFKAAVKKVIRLGKREENGMSRPRPIKLVLENEKVRNRGMHF